MSEVLEGEASCEVPLANSTSAFVSHFAKSESGVKSVHATPKGNRGVLLDKVSPVLSVHFSTSLICASLLASLSSVHSHRQGAMCALSTGSQIRSSHSHPPAKA